MLWNVPTSVTAGQVLLGDRAIRLAHPHCRSRASANVSPPTAAHSTDSVGMQIDPVGLEDVPGRAVTNCEVENCRWSSALQARNSVGQLCRQQRLPPALTTEFKFYYIHPCGAARHGTRRPYVGCRCQMSNVEVETEMDRSSSCRHAGLSFIVYI